MSRSPGGAMLEERMCEFQADATLEARVPTATYAEGEVIYSIEAMELRFTYEPIIRVRDWMCVGAEARVSWRHPRRGLLSSEVVMPYIERMPRRVATVTEVILDEATASCRRWREEGRPLGVWVRLPAGLRHDELAVRAGRLARANGLPTEALTIQLAGGTPRVLTPSAEATAVELRAEGIRVALEHGTADRPWSAGVPANEVAFTMPDESGARTSVAEGAWADVLVHAKRRGLTTACRNVVSQSAWTAAESAGCDLAQGTFIARAAAAPEFARWARRWMPSTTV